MECGEVNMDHNQKILDIEKILKDNGYKLTGSRKLMIKIFVDSKIHMRPDDVYQLLRNDRISLPTVYRNIEIFKETGVIKELPIQNERYYELEIYSGKKMHIHFQCQSCGIIKEYSDLELIKMMIAERDFIETNHGDRIDDVTIVMSGTCKICLK
jgi:Fe2+ or Zn2+ uptake regulation protein